MARRFQKGMKGSRKFKLGGGARRPKGGRAKMSRGRY